MESKVYLILSICWFLLIISAGFLGARLYCKSSLSRGLWWDDHLLILSWILVATDVICISVSVHHGFGRHFEDIDPQSLPTIILCGLISATTSVLAASISKTSFILTLMRITVCCARHFLRFAIVSMNILLTLAAIFFWTECTPLAMKWNPTIEGKCWPKSVLVCYGVVTCGYSAFLNLVLSLLPWKLTEKLQMVRKEKIGVAVAMSFGIFACAAATVKCYYIPLVASGDFSFDGANLVIWSVVEPAVVIIGASIPILRVMFRDIRSQHANSRNYGVLVTCGARGNCKTTKTITVNKGSDVDRSIASPVDSVHPKFPVREEVDSGSDKSILGRDMSLMPDNRGILQVSEIKVEYSERKRSDSSEGYEMEDV